MIYFYIYPIICTGQNLEHYAKNQSFLEVKVSTGNMKYGNLISVADKYELISDITKIIFRFCELDTTKQTIQPIKQYIRLSLSSFVFKASLDKLFSTELDLNDINQVVYNLFLNEAKQFQLLFDGITEFTKNKSETDQIIFNNTIITEVCKNLDNQKNLESKETILTNIKDHIYAKLYIIFILECFNDYNLLKRFFCNPDLIHLNLLNSKPLGGAHSKFIFDDIICKHVNNDLINSIHSSNITEYQNTLGEFITCIFNLCDCIVTKELLMCENDVYEISCYKTKIDKKEMKDFILLIDNIRNDKSIPAVFSLLLDKIIANINTKLTHSIVLNRSEAFICVKL